MAGYALDAVLQKLSEIAPLRLAESWDNVGLLVGRRSSTVRCLMTCLTITPNVVVEAIERQVDLIVTHHPLPFKPLTRVNSDSTVGQLLLELIGNRIAVYSAHTAFDSAPCGINAMWAEMLSLTQVRPLEPILDWPDDSVGSGRFGLLEHPISLADFTLQVSALVAAPHARIVSSTGDTVKKVAIACGSGGNLIAAAKRCGCDTMITGEATFHQCLEAQASGIQLVLVGHYYSERFAMERLASLLAEELNGLDVFTSRCELDPLKASS